MALRLGEVVKYGELRNTRPYSTSGYIVLRGESPENDVAIHLELTGDCESDLKGKHFRFIANEDDPMAATFDPTKHGGIKPQQIGPTGTMTAQGWVRQMPCSVKEFYRRSKLGEPPPTTWTDRLYLEWHSQDGRVVIELAGARVEYCTREPEGEGDEGDWANVENLALPPGLPGDEPSGPSITIVRRTGEGIDIEHVSGPPDSDSESPSIPDELQRQLDRESAAIDRALDRGDEGDGLDDVRLLDQLIEEGDEKPVLEILAHLNELPRPEHLDDEMAEGYLKHLLSELAFLGISLHVCDHFTPRTCYALLLEKILPDMTTFEELIGTNMVQGVSTSDFCKACEAEIERELEENQRP